MPISFDDSPWDSGFLALKQSLDIGCNAEAERGLLIKLLDRFSSKHPQPHMTHYSGTLGKYYFKWAQHTEFVTYFLFCVDLSINELLNL